MCGRKLSLILLVFLLVSVQFSWSLSDEEVQILPTLETPTLVQIILEYDRGLTTAENDLTNLQTITNQQKILLEQEKTALEKQEKLFRNLLEKEKIKTDIAYTITGVSIISLILVAIAN